MLAYRSLRLGLALSMIVLVSACLERRSEEEMRDSIVYGYESDVYTFDPAKQRMMKENAIMAQVLEGLVRWNNDVEMEPCLATSWESEDNCKRWIFHLRPNVRFHDGVEFTSEAVKIALDRIRDPATVSTRAHLIAHVEEITTPDPLTVVFQLKTEDCVFLETLTGIFATIPSPAAIKKDKELPIAQNPVGTGPFRFVEWVPGTSILFERNPDYWNEDVIKLQQLEFRPVRENTTRLILLEQGVLDMADVAFPQVNVARNNDDISLQATPQLAVRYVGFNTQKPPFDNPRVRQAANYAVNRDEMIEYMFFGVGEPARGPLPSALPNYNHELEPYTYDPEKARQLLAEAGYPDGFDCVLWTMETGEYRVAADATVEYLRQVGIRVDMKIFDNAVYWSKFDEYLVPGGERYPTREGVFDMYIGGWVGGESAHAYLEPLFKSDSSSNNSFYDNPRFDELIVKVKLSPDETTRSEIYKEMQAILMEDAPWIFAYHSQVNVGLRERVKGFRVNASSRYFFQDVYTED